MTQERMDRERRSHGDSTPASHTHPQHARALLIPSVRVTPPSCLVHVTPSMGTSLPRAATRPPPTSPCSPLRSPPPPNPYPHTHTPLLPPLQGLLQSSSHLPHTTTPHLRDAQGGVEVGPPRPQPHHRHPSRRQTTVQPPQAAPQPPHPLQGTPQLAPQSRQAGGGLAHGTPWVGTFCPERAATSLRRAISTRSCGGEGGGAGVARGR